MTRVCLTGQSPAKVDDRADIIRKATANDLPGIVRVHCKAFSKFFLTRLGRDFLRKYYSLVINYHSGIILVSEQNFVLQGFACGFVNPEEFYQLMWNAKRTFALPVLSALFRHPSLITKIFYGVQRIHTPTSGWPARSCELSSIAVAPETNGNGFGKALIQAFLSEARSMDARCVYLTTDADGNETVNAFYRALGFQRTRCFMQGSQRLMNEYVISGFTDSAACAWQP